jgi:DNA-binding transcriptional LysR family regulator
MDQPRRLAQHVMLGLTFDQLFAVRTIANTGSFREAGKVLCLTQPAVSHRVRQIERMLGHRIFERRSGVGVTLTAAGELLLQFCESSIRSLGDFADELNTLELAPKSGIGIIAPSDITEYVLIPTLALLPERRRQGVHLYQVYEHDAMMSMLTSGKVDLVFDRWPTDPSLVALARMEDQMMLVAAPDHPLLAVPVADRPAALSAIPFAIHGPGMRIRGLVDRWAAKIGATITPFLESRNISTMKAAVLQAGAVAVLPSSAASPELATGELRAVEIADMPLTRSSAVATLPADDTLDRVRAFVKHFVKAARERPDLVAVTEIRQVST